MKRKAILITGFHPESNTDNKMADILSNHPLKEKDLMEYIMNLTMEYFHRFLESSIGGCWDKGAEIKRYYASSKKQSVIDEIESEECDFILLYFMGHSCIKNGKLVLGLSQTEELLLSELELTKSRNSLIIIDGCRSSTMQISGEGYYPSKLINTFDKFEFQHESKTIYNEYLISSNNAHCKVFSTQPETKANIHLYQGPFFSVALVNTAVEWATKESNIGILRFEDALKLVEKELLKYPQESGYCQRPDWEKVIEFPLAIKL